MSYLFDGINHPTVKQVHDSGAVGCLMYGGTPADSLGKDFTAAQYASYRAAGLLSAFVYEATANDMAGGFNAGAAHASALLADLRNKGVASTEPVAATIDEHVTAANIPLAVQYQQGFWSAIKASGWAGPVGVYGFAEVLIACHNAGIADWYWGAGNRSTLPPYTNVWQDNTGVINVGGSADDRDWILIPLPTGGDMLDPTNPTDETVIAGAESCLPGIAGTRPAGDLYLLCYNTQQQVAALQQTITVLTTTLDAVQHAVSSLQPAPELTGQAAVTIQLGAPAAPPAAS